VCSIVYAYCTVYKTEFIDYNCPCGIFIHLLDFYYMQRSFNRGFSAVAAVIIAAVVIGGGVAAVSMTSSGSADVDNERNQQATSTAETQTQADATSSRQTAKTTFRCDDGQTTTLAFTGQTNADLTLPDGEVVAVSRTETEDGAAFQSADGSVNFRNTQQGAVVEREGEVTVSGCVSEAARTHGSTDSRTTSTMETGTNTEAEVEADVDAETDVEADSDVDSETNGTSSESNMEVEASTETEVEAGTAPSSN
jgi:hypothetical protein